jgi:hypothetical protein
LDAFKDIFNQSVSLIKISKSKISLALQRSILGEPMEFPFDVLLAAFNTNLTEAERNAR